MTVRFLLGVALAAFAVNASAQPRTADPAKRGLKPGDLPRIVKITGNVYGYEGIHDSGMPTVSLIVIGNDGVLVADGQGSPEATQAMLDAIAKVTTKPLKWYVVGSDHGDHTGGNSVLPKDLAFIVSPASKAQLERDAATAKPPRVVVVPPAAMAGDKQVVNVGGTEVQVLNLGRAHTGGDLSVFLPKEGILFMSEAYLNRVFPAMRSAYPSEWLKTLDRAIAMNVAALHSGAWVRRGSEGGARGAPRIPQGAAVCHRRGETASQTGPVGRRRAQAGELGTLQGMVPLRFAGLDRDPKGL